MQINDTLNDIEYAKAHGMPKAQIDQIGTLGTQCDLCGHSYAFNRLSFAAKAYEQAARLGCYCQECIDEQSGDY